MMSPSIWSKLCKWGEKMRPRNINLSGSTPPGMEVCLEFEPCTLKSRSSGSSNKFSQQQFLFCLKNHHKQKQIPRHTTIYTQNISPPPPDPPKKGIKGTILTGLATEGILLSTLDGWQIQHKWR